MTIYHDAYLFSVDDFIQFLHANMPQTSDDATTWQNLKELALKFTEGDFVLYLSDIYGSWDYEGLKQELADTDQSYVANHIFMLFLYRYLAQFSEHPKGLGSNWQVLEAMDSSFQHQNIIENNSKHLIIYGHPLNDLLEHNNLKDSLLSKHIEARLHPYATGSWAGFLTYDELASIEADFQKLIKLVSSDTEIYHAISQAITLSQLAINAKMGLCIITSG